MEDEVLNSNYMDELDVPAANEATCFVTIEGKRKAMLNAKNFEAKANIKTKEVAILGKRIRGRKAAGMDLPFKMTIYKCTEVFDEVVEKYKNTGKLPPFEIQVTNNDSSTSIGASSKTFTGCILDGDVLLAMFDAEGDYVTQEISGYASNFARAQQYTEPSYMSAE